MRQFFAALHETILDLWSHRLTAFIGGVAAVANFIDLLTKFGGLVAVLVAIYCSLARNAREKRASELQLRKLAGEEPKAQ